MDQIGLEIRKEQEPKVFEDLKQRGFPDDPNKLIGHPIYIEGEHIGGCLTTITAVSRLTPFGLLLHKPSRRTW